MATLTSQLPLTSFDAARLLLGPYYQEYGYWQHILPFLPQADIDKYFGGSKDFWDGCRDIAYYIPFGGIPDTLTYKIFMHCMRVDRKLLSPNTDPLPPSSLTVAPICGHAAHPGGPSLDLCPVCEMDLCVASLARIRGVWELLGGPGKRYPTEHYKRLYYQVRALWWVEKTRWANLVGRYEGLAEEEKEWEATQLEPSAYSLEEVAASKSYAEALRGAWSAPGLVEGAEEPFVPAERGVREKKRVVFA